MSRILKATLLVDSNVYRYATADRMSSRSGCSITMINVTRQATLDLSLETAKSDVSSLVLVSVLSNLLSDVGRGAKEDELEQCLKTSVSSFVHLLATQLASKQRVLVLPPFFRSDPKWFGDYLPVVKNTLELECSKHQIISLLPDFPVSGVDLMDDGVHLLPEKGVSLISHIGDCLKDIALVLTPTHSNPGTSASLFMQSHDNPTVMDVVTAIKTQILPQIDELTHMKGRMTVAEQAVLKRLEALDVAAARRAEGEDYLRNRSTADRVVVVGLKSDDYPGTPGERKTFLSQIFRGLIESISGEIVFDIYPRDEDSLSGLIPAFDVKFPTAKVCQDFRRAAFKKIKEEPFTDQFGGVTFFPKVTMGTRVRFEVLRALSRKVSSTEESAYCPIYETRPVLHVGPRKDGKVDRKLTLTYVDAVLRYKHLVNISDLAYAYKRVGNGFKGELVQNFLILRDEDRLVSSSNAVQIGGGFRGRGVKRRYEGRGRGGISKRGK